MSRDSFLSSLVAGNPAEPLLRRLVDHLVANRYSASAATAYTRAAVHLGRWLDGRSITLDLADHYLDRHLPRCRCKPIAPRDRRWNAGMIRHVLPLAGITRPAVAGVGGAILTQYRDHLIRERGLKPASVQHYAYYAARTFAALGPRTAAEVKRWTPADVQRHARAELAGRAGSTNSSKSAMLRVFLRFLHRQRLTAVDLSGAVPKVPFRRSARVPRAVDPGVAERLLAASGADRTPQGLRNHLILLSLHELGLRASDLLGLHLGDLQLDRRVLDVRRPKGRRELVLPISKRLADAFAAYVGRGRPRCDAPWVFVHHRAPAGRRLTTAGVRDILLELSLRAGLADPIESTHAFRRALQALLDASAAGTSPRSGRRDQLLLLLLYNTGARVSELAALRVRDVDLGPNPAVRIQGKGRKQRSVPLWRRTAELLRGWLSRPDLDPDSPLVPNARGKPMTRYGVAQRLKCVAGRAGRADPALRNVRVTPHVIRHTTAMHLLQSGVDLSVIALWLGHEHVQTTHGYLAADLEVKKRALACLRHPRVGRTKVGPVPTLSFLNSL